jgi:hypothetical protein
MEQGRIHSLELLELAIDAASRLGYRIREDALGGFPGGACQIKDQKWLFLDPAQSTRERLLVVLAALAVDPGTAAVELSAPLAGLLKSMRLTQSKGAWQAP